MKKFRIIFTIILLLISIFFVVYAKIQTGRAMELEMEANKLKNEAVATMDEAMAHAARATEEAANARMAQQVAEEAMAQLFECEGK